jgi:superfamily II DNA or RNA helicase
MYEYKITPDILSSYVNFYFDKSDWTYCQNDTVSMPKLQAEGAAKIWNLLLDQKIALLADEVGMGKTIEALSVMATLWRQKPIAKVLLYTPNDNVAQHWIREYNNFVRYHYRISDDIVKSSISNEPIRKAVFCRNHVELLKNTSEQWPSLFVCKTSSLSGLTSDRISDEILENIGIQIRKNDYSKSEEKKWMRDFAFESNDFLYEKLSQDGDSPFDLLIFDEAHYLRRTEGEDSNRSIVAHAFFAKRDITQPNNSFGFRSLAKMVLLMTATPNHSSKSDINNIVGLFKPDLKTKKAEDILKMVCVRRLRRLEGKTKHEYREEKPVEVKLSKLSEKLFFAAYHKSIVDYRARNIEQSKQNNPYRILWGYLEGFEFLPRKKEENKAKTNKDDSGSGGDFSEREDSGVIMDLSSKYVKAYGKPPEHPKYNKITDDLTPESAMDFRIEKKLVFVRRIPSVKEIAARIIKNYDELFLSIVKNALSEEKKKKVNIYNLRQTFWNLSQSENESLSEKDEDATKEEKSDKIDEEIPYSEVLDLFTIKKDKKYRTTDCSNFRVRFTRNGQFFSLFFEPASDYKGGTYLLKTAYEVSGRRVYKSTAQFERINKIENEQIRLKLETNYGVSSKPNSKTELKRNFDTLFSLWYKTELKFDRLKNLKIKALQEYESWNLNEREGFSNYLEKGILFSSPFIIHFYSYYRILLCSFRIMEQPLKLRFAQFLFLQSPGQ